MNVAVLMFYAWTMIPLTYIGVIAIIELFK